MALLIRRSGQREYAYLVRRIGGRVVHTYLGPTRDPAVRARMLEHAAQRRLPSFLHSLFWDTSPQDIDVGRHSRYILERILEMGSLKAMAWAQQAYPGRLILEVAQTSRSVSERSRNFWRLWLGA